MGAFRALKSSVLVFVSLFVVTFLVLLGREQWAYKYLERYGGIE